MLVAPEYCGMTIVAGRRQDSIPQEREGFSHRHITLYYLVAYLFFHAVRAGPYTITYCVRVGASVFSASLSGVPKKR